MPNDDWNSLNPRSSVDSKKTLNQRKRKHSMLKLLAMLISLLFLEIILVFYFSLE